MDIPTELVARLPAHLPTRAELRIRHDDGVVREVHGVPGPALDPGGRVADDKVELTAHLCQHLADCVHGQGVLILGLGGREQEKVRVPLVLDHRLLERAVPLQHVDEVEYYSSFRALEEAKGVRREERG